MTIEATYDPADDKIRVRASARLPREVYDRVRAAGFGWAPKQDLFYAVWSPAREDLALELAGADELGDEDTSLVERAADRAERFDGYSERRAADAHGARAAVASIADNIPFGQPILVGHHSERRARKDAERIRSGMAKAAKMWKTSEYWERRAAGAVRHAEYKELPAVRARRIKGLESDLRKSQRGHAQAVKTRQRWDGVGLDMRRAVMLASDPYLVSVSRCYTLAEFPRQPPASQHEGEMGLWSALDGGIINAEQARDFVLPACERTQARAQRWIDHLTNRIAYERAMLTESGGLKGEAFAYEVGGQVNRRGVWLPIVKVNRRDGGIMSLTVLGHFASTVTLDEVKDYRPPAPGMAEKVAAVMDKGPMCNYPGAGFVHMTAAEWKALHRYSDCKYTEIHKATETHGRHRTKCRPMPGFTSASVFITDAKRVDPPAPSAPAAPVQAEREESDAEAIRAQAAALASRRHAQAAREEAAAPFKAIEQSLKAGIQVVSAPQLFPTPAALAAEMVAKADIGPGMRVLEPSAGTGAILLAIGEATRHARPEIMAVEINRSLADALEARHMADSVWCHDFLATKPATLGEPFDRIVMNPPFVNGADIAHINHALTFLVPTGRLVALCADGPGRREAFQPLIDDCGGSYDPLPSGAFRSQGTDVRVAMVVMNGASRAAGWPTLDGERTPKGASD